MLTDVTNADDVPVKHSAIGRGVDAVTEARRLAAPSAEDVSVLGVRILAPAEIGRRTLAALVRVEAQNEAALALLTEIRDALRSSRGRG